MTYYIYYEISKNGKVLGTIRGRKAYKTEKRAAYAARLMKEKTFASKNGYSYRTYISQDLQTQ